MQILFYENQTKTMLNNRKSAIHYIKPEVFEWVKGILRQ